MSGKNTFKHPIVIPNSHTEYRQVHTCPFERLQKYFDRFDTHCIEHHLYINKIVCGINISFSISYMLHESQAAAINAGFLQNLGIHE